MSRLTKNQDSHQSEDTLRAELSAMMEELRREEDINVYEQNGLSAGIPKLPDDPQKILDRMIQNARASFLPVGESERIR